MATTICGCGATREGVEHATWCSARPSWRFVALDGQRETGLTLEAATTMLQQYAKTHNLKLHLHYGSWEGDNVLSSAYPKGGDMMLDALAVVRKGVL